MTIIGLNGEFLLVNKAFEDFVGYSQDELMGLKVFEITHPEDRQNSVDQRGKVISEGRKSNQEEKRYIRKDGTIVWGLLDRAVVKDDDGNILYTIGQVQDINELKASELALRESENRLRDFIMAAADRYWETDENHR